MSEESIVSEQGVLTESVIVDSGIIGVGEDVHPITNDELADVFVDAFDKIDEEKEDESIALEEDKQKGEFTEDMREKCRIFSSAYESQGTNSNNRHIMSTAPTDGTSGSHAHGVPRLYRRSAADKPGRGSEKMPRLQHGIEFTVDEMSLSADAAALISGRGYSIPEEGFASFANDEKVEKEDTEDVVPNIAEDDAEFNAALDAALGVDALPETGTEEQKAPQPPAAAAPQPSQQGNSEPAAPERPALDRDALKQYVVTHQAEMNGTAKMTAAEQTPQQEGETDVVAAQETMKDIKNGDTYTGSDGKKWKYTVVEFSVVPEDVKDEMADDIGEKEPNLEDSPAAQDAAPYQYSTPAPYQTGRSGVETSARKKATMTHRRNVAATWEDCKAKEKAKCPYHGAAYMTDQIKKVLMARGLPLGKFAIVGIDPETATASGDKSLRRYRLVFSQPDDISDADSNAVVKDFFASMPNVMFENRESDYAEAGSDAKTFHQSEFEIADEPEDAGDIPLDAPTAEEENERRDTPQEYAHYIRSRQRERGWGYKDDPELGQADYLNMLSEKPSNIVACNDDMMRYATQFPEALPQGVTLDQVKATYDKFKKANDLHKGLSAFILNGEVVPEADALAEAATLGKEKEAKKYREAASEVYDLASQVFGGVQEALSTKLRAIQAEIPKLPSSLAINSAGELHHTRYLGKDFTCSKDQFPTNQSGPLWDSLRGLQKLYETQYRNMKQLEMFRIGCEQREPTRAYFGLVAFQKCVRDLKDTANKIGEIQDTFLSAKGPAWAEKHGFKMKKNKASAKGNPEQTSEAPETAEKQERTPAKAAEQGKKVQIPGLGTVELDKSIEDEIKKAAAANPKLQALNTKQQQIGQKYGIDSPEFKSFYDQARSQFQDFFDTERVKRYGEKAKKAHPEAAAEKPEQPAKSTKKTEKKPKAKKPDRKATYLKKFKEISEKSGQSLNGSSLDELFNSGYGVFKDSSGNEFLARKLPEGKIDTTKPYYALTSVFKAFGEGMTAKEFANTLKYQERDIAEKKSKEAEQTDWYDQIFGVS